MALSYIGGKSRIGTWIRNYIPNDIETFVEPFSGMFWVFFRLELSNYPNLKTVVYNDFNPLNVNNDLGELTISANPVSTIISSTYNRIITVDPFDPNAIIVNLTAKS